MNTLFLTDHLVARHITRDDFDVMYATYSDPDAMRWVDDGQPIPYDDCKRWVDVTLDNYASRGYGMSALCLRRPDGMPEDGMGEVIGFCGLVHPDGQVEPEIKYALRRPHWGRGLATEAAAGMLAYGARAFGMRRIIATIAPDNLASQRVVGKAGMAFAETVIDPDGSSTAVWVWSADDPSRRGAAVR